MPWILRLALLVLVSALAPVSAWAQVELDPPVSGHRGDDIDSADVLARARVIEAHVERLRKHMGRPVPPPPILVVKSAAPREVLFAAGNLRRRLAALQFERLRRETPWRTDYPQRAIRPADVFRQVQLAIPVIETIEATFGLKGDIEEQLVEEEVTPAQVMNELIHLGALVEGLMERPSMLNGAYVYTTYAMLFALEVHRVRTNAMMPPAPPMVPGQTNVDAVHQLLACMKRIRAIFAKLEVPAAEVELRLTEGRHPTADDLSNLVALILAELIWLRGRVPGTRQPIEPYMVGPKLPSDVVQRAGLLEAILADIEAAPGLGPESITR